MTDYRKDLQFHEALFDPIKAVNIAVRHSIRIPELESIISTDPAASAYYASNVLHSRFPEGKPAIFSDPFFLVDYVKFIFKQRMPCLEYIVSQDTTPLIDYALFILPLRSLKLLNPLYPQVYSLSDVYINLISSMNISRSAISKLSPDLKYQFLQDFINVTIPTFIEIFSVQIEQHSQFENHLPLKNILFTTSRLTANNPKAYTPLIRKLIKMSTGLKKGRRHRRKGRKKENHRRINKKMMVIRNMEKKAHIKTPSQHPQQKTLTQLINSVQPPYTLTTNCLNHA